jgi:hypothetical protein
MPVRLRQEVQALSWEVRVALTLRTQSDEPKQPLQRLPEQRLALGGIRKQHFHQFDQRAVILPLRRAGQLKVDASGAEANGNSRQNLGSLGLVF